MATVVVLTTRRARGAGTRGDDDGSVAPPSATRALVGALLGHEDDLGGSAATSRSTRASTRDDDAGTPTWRDALSAARDALDAAGAARDTIVALSSTTDLPLDGRVALTHPTCAEHGARRALFVGDGDDVAWARDALIAGLDPTDPGFDGDGDGDGDGAVRVLADGDAARGDVVDAMRWLAAGARSGDSMLMHVASRVSPAPVSGTDIHERLVKRLPRGAWLVLVLDVGGGCWWGGAAGCRGFPGVPSYGAEHGIGDDARRCAMAPDPFDSVMGDAVTSAAARLAAGLRTFGGDDGGVVGPMDAIAVGGGGGGGKRRGEASSKPDNPSCCAVQ